MKHWHATIFLTSGEKAIRELDELDELQDWVEGEADFRLIERIEVKYLLTERRTEIVRTLSPFRSGMSDPVFYRIVDQLLKGN